jgi:hypothetical protein
MEVPHLGQQQNSLSDSQLLQVASAPRLSKGKGGRSALKVNSALLLLLLKGMLPCAAAVQNLLAQLHLPISARFTPDLISSGLGSAERAELADTQGHGEV